MNKNVTIAVDEKGIIYLKSDKYDLVCPFRNPYMVPGRVQGMFGIAKETCNSTCPHFHHHQNGVDDVVTLTCGHKPTTFEQERES